jgi:hypothetical protein
MRKQQFKRPEPNFSMYEGRTRGKRMKYTYSDEEDEGYSDTTSRRSTRNTGTHTPAEPAGPTITLSGRQVRSRQGGVYGESRLSGTHTPVVTVGGNDGTSEEHDEDGDIVGRRPRRAAAVQSQNGYKSGGGQHIEGYNSVDEMDDEDDASEQDYGDDEEDDHVSIESDVEDSDNHSNDDDEMEDDLLNESRKKSLVVKLPVKTPTPEKKVAMKKSPAPEEKSGELPRPTAAINPTSNMEGKVDTTATESKVPQVAPGPPNQGISNASSGAGTSKPINVPTQPDVNRMLPSPLSPSLAYRGSPEKPPHRFVAPINVSRGGV